MTPNNDKLAELRESHADNIRAYNSPNDSIGVPIALAIVYAAYLVCWTWLTVKDKREE